jgi:transcriptional regulator with XRE-family HTH domain
MPPTVRRSLSKFGQDIANARRRRHLTAAMMAERMGVSANTYRRIEKGDPAVAMGGYAMALFVLGLGAPLNDLADARRDDVGLQMEEERLPKRIRIRKTPTSL